MVVSRPRGESDGLLAVTSRDALEGEYAVTFDHARWTLAGADLREAAEEGRRRKLAAGLGDRSAEIVAVVKDHPDGITPTEVAEKLGMGNDDAGQYLRRLVKIGLIDKAGRGVYLPRVRLSEVSERAVKADISPTVRELSPREGRVRTFGHSDSPTRARAKPAPTAATPPHPDTSTAPGNAPKPTETTSSKPRRFCPGPGSRATP